MLLVQADSERSHTFVPFDVVKQASHVPCAWFSRPKEIDRRTARAVLLSICVIPHLVGAVSALHGDDVYRRGATECPVDVHKIHRYPPACYTLHHCAWDRCQ
jgi:hypothetical protein